MFDHCQPVLINNLYGLLTINTTDSSSCIKPRQWYFFYDYGYTLLIRFINIAHLLSNSYIFKIYSIINKQKTLVYDSTKIILANNEIQFDIKDKNSGLLVELISIKKENIQQTSFLIDYIFRTTSQSRFGRQILQDNSSTSSSSSSFNPSQPSFIALICIIAILVLAIVIAITILCYRYYSHRQHTKKRRKIRKKFRRVSNDQAHLAASITPSSVSSYSIRSSQGLFSNHQPTETPQQTSSLGQSISTLPSMIPSRRLQQSMMDAYLNDFNSFQPKIIDPKQLNSYLFVDLHSTSSETFPEVVSKKYSNDNTTTSGYDTSTGGEDRNSKNSLRHRRRRYYHHQQRQRRRSTIALKRSHGARFLMRERSLPNASLKLPKLRLQQHHLFNLRDDNNNSSTTSNNNQDLISTNLSITTDDYDESHAYHVNQSRTMDTIEEEEKPSTSHQPYFFEMVSTHRGDDSDMPNYEDMPIPFRRSSTIIGDGIAYVNDSIIV